VTDTAARHTSTPVPIGAARAFGLWGIGWVLGPFVAASLVLTLWVDDFDDAPIGALLAATAAGWAVFLGVLWWGSTHDGTGDLRRDLAVAVRPIDLVAVPAGVLTQLVLVPALYRPLRHFWPDTFSPADIEERAQDLVDRAGGFDTVLLVLLVAVGAPIVEELVYRGLLQRSVGSRIGAWWSLVAVSALFALIHLSPVEIPGLFLAGLVFGVGVVLTGRLGPALLSHAAFNVTGLVILLR
jgi:membrane protease YdiL (CAAX protease family)